MANSNCGARNAAAIVLCEARMRKARIIHIPLPAGGFKVVIYTCGHKFVLRGKQTKPLRCPECGAGKVDHTE